MVQVDGVEWWSVPEVAAYLDCKPNTVRAYLARGQMPESTKFGNSPMWRREEIEAWAATRRP